MIDWQKWEMLQRREKAMASEVEYLQTQVADRRRAEVMQKDLFRRAVENRGLSARRNMKDFLDEYQRDPNGVIAGLQADGSPALACAEEHQFRLAALRRTEDALSDAERRLAAFRPAYFRMRDYVATVGAYQ